MMAERRSIVFGIACLASLFAGEALASGAPPASSGSLLELPPLSLPGTSAPATITPSVAHPPAPATPPATAPAVPTTPSPPLPPAAPATPAATPFSPPPAAPAAAPLSQQSVALPALPTVSVTTPSPVATPATVSASAPASPPAPPVPAAVQGPIAPGAARQALPGVPLPVPPGTSSTIKSVHDTITRNQETLIEPLHPGRISMMFSKTDMDVILSGLEAYDNNHGSQKAETVQNKSDLSTLLDSLTHESKPIETLRPLPNLYLGSIVYYTPGYWSVWINGRKLIARNNRPANELFVSRISRGEIELVWRPASLMDLPTLWKKRTETGEPPRGIALDESKATLTLRMRPNQTFIPKELAIREGLIKFVPAATPALTPAPAPAAANAAAPGTEPAHTPPAK